MTARVLVVDDQPANVKLLEAMLNAEYFEVVTASNGEEALAVCARGLCDLVLLDVMMPGMDGLEVCRRLKQNPQTAQLPVIIVTALDQPSDRLRGLEAGADDFLTKPINELALITRVKSLVRLKTLTDQLMVRASASSELGMADPFDGAVASGDHGRILLVEDKPGLLTRVAGLFARRGFNIHSLAVGTSEVDGLSRITVVVDVEELPLEQVTKQLNKLINVIKIVELDPAQSVQREHLLIKVRVDNSTRSQVLEAVNLFRARVVDVATDALVIEVTGDSGKTQALLKVLEPYGIKEMAQSGLLAIGRGGKSITERVFKN